MPLTILVTSIMTFGNFAEKYEFAAMKSAGMSLQRAMRSLIVFILFIAVLAFLFANNIIPIAAYKSINLRKNIAQLQPSMAIVEGAFNDLGDDLNIKVEKKSGDNDQFLKDVIIHQKPKNGRGDMTVIKAKRGELIGSTNYDLLSLVLYDGNYYNDVFKKEASEQAKKPFAKSQFDEYTINIDLSNFNKVDLGDENYSNSSKMLKISELTIEMDSLSNDFNRSSYNFRKSIAARQGLNRLGSNIVKNDSLLVESGKPVMSNYEDRKKRQILTIALGSLNGTIVMIDGKQGLEKRKHEELNKFEIALHEKYVIGIACIILFFVGAPLGAIIRKGGMGLPLVVSILLFLTYHFIGVMTKNSAENGSISPFVGVWLSTFIMFPLSIYLTYRATTDQGFFNSDAIMDPIRKLTRKIGLFKKN